MVAVLVIVDPNATLEALRMWASSVTRDDSSSYSEARGANLFQALDEWLTGGGFPPEGWEPPGWARDYADDDR